MAEMMCCPLSSGGDDCPAECFTEEVRTAAKDHRCCECREPITKGSKYEHVKGMWDGSWSTYKTCMSCVEIRRHFGCDGWLYGQLWEDLEGNFFPNMTAGGPCMAGLSPAAKARMFELRLKWAEDNAS